jgi:hypothetical protein
MPDEPKKPRLDDLIAIARAAAGSDDAIAQLSAAAGLKSDVDDLTDALLGHFVDQARRAGCSWSQIGSALGVSKQAAQQKHTASFDFSRFTERARTALVEADACSHRLGHAYVGTEHVLAGLAAVPAGIAGKILAAGGLDHAAVEAGIVGIIPAGAPLGEQEKCPYTPKAALALAGTLTIALGLGHNYIGTEHMLLALAQGEETVARTILDGAGFTAESIRAQVIQELTRFTKGK